MHNFKKSLGQNFLNNPKFPKEVVRLLDVKPTDIVIEIGPGQGILSSELIKTGCKVISIEIDYDLLANLIKNFREPNFELLHKDFLEIDLEELVAKYKLPESTSIKFAGSLPYNLGKMIVNKICLFSYQNNIKNNVKVEKAAFILQEEVVQNYTARAPKATFLSNSLNAYGKTKKGINISPLNFYPVPKVTSSILTIEFDKEFTQKYNPEDLIKFIKGGFLNPRKNIFNNLKSAYKSEEISNVLRELNIDRNKRPAELETATWIELFSKLSNTQKL